MAPVVTTAATLSMNTMDFGEAQAPQRTSNTQKVDVEDWSRLRTLVFEALHAQVCQLPVYDICMAVIVVSNVCVMAVETDNGAECVKFARCHAVPWLRAVNLSFLVVYCLDCVMRCFVQRLSYFRDFWNLLDLLVATLGVIQELFQDASSDLGKANLLRIFRVVRIVRVLKILRWLPTLWSLVSGLIGALEAMIWGLVLVMLLVYMWSIISVEMLHPIAWELFGEGGQDDSWCQAAFSTVTRATLYLFVTLVAGDAWGQCAVPIIEHTPTTWAIFACSLVTIQLGFLNLVLAVIVDKAAEAREASKEDKAEQKRQAVKMSLGKWVDVMKRLDSDSSGTINMEELLEGYKDDVVKEVMSDMGIEEGDLKVMFSLMDTDNSGSLSYNEFIRALAKAQTQDHRVSMMMMQLRLEHIQNAVCHRLDRHMSELDERLEMMSSSASMTVRQSLPSGAPPAAPESPLVPGLAAELRAFSADLDRRLLAMEARAVEAVAAQASEIATAVLGDVERYRRGVPAERDGCSAAAGATWREEDTAAPPGAAWREEGRPCAAMSSRPSRRSRAGGAHDGDPDESFSL